MATVDDVLYHIAQELRDYSGADRYAAIDEFFTGCSFQFDVSMTTDVEASELHYLEKYGQGHTFYFRVFHFEHSRILIDQLSKWLTGEASALNQNMALHFPPDAKVYLFVHVRDVSPVPVRASSRVREMLKE